MYQLWHLWLCWCADVERRINQFQLLIEHFYANVYQFLLFLIIPYRTHCSGGTPGGIKDKQRLWYHHDIQQHSNLLKVSFTLHAALKWYFTLISATNLQVFVIFYCTELHLNVNVNLQKLQSSKFWALKRVDWWNEREKSTTSYLLLALAKALSTSHPLALHKVQPESQLKIFQCGILMTKLAMAGRLALVCLVRSSAPNGRYCLAPLMVFLDWGLWPSWSLWSWGLWQAVATSLEGSLVVNWPDC